MKQKNTLKRIYPIILLFHFFVLQSVPTPAQIKKNPRSTTQKGKKNNQAAPDPKGKTKLPEKKVFKPGSKEELQEWEKRKKNMRPLQLRDLIEENARLRMQLQAILTGEEIKEVTNEHDNINQQYLTNEANGETSQQGTHIGPDGTPIPGSEGTSNGQNSPTGSLNATKNTGAIPPNATNSTGKIGGIAHIGKAGIDPATKVIGSVGAAGAAAGLGAIAGAVGSRSSTDQNKLNQTGSQSLNNPAAIGSTFNNQGYTSGAILTDSDKASNMAARELQDLPPGSYQINTETGQVLIGGIVDDRYGVDPATGIPFIKGILFKVQIGIKEEVNLREKLADEYNHQTLEQEEEQNIHKYTIGHFRNYWAADEVKKLLRTMGIEHAWIVPYKDGKRVLLKEVLPTVIAQKDNQRT